MKGKQVSVSHEYDQCAILRGRNFFQNESLLSILKCQWVSEAEVEARNKAT